MRPRIYIAGPMRGYPDLNRPAFFAAEQVFRAAGYAVANPVRIGEIFGADDSTPAEDYLREDLLHLVRCSAICLLDGWAMSTGARCEAAVAMTLGLSIYRLDDEAPHGFCRVRSMLPITIRGGYELDPASGGYVAEGAA